MFDLPYMSDAQCHVNFEVNVREGKGSIAVPACRGSFAEALSFLDVNVAPILLCPSFAGLHKHLAMPCYWAALHKSDAAHSKQAAQGAQEMIEPTLSFVGWALLYSDRCTGED
eukprot:1160653-Pelagomonas_calceolata.AAC.21